MIKSNFDKYNVVELCLIDDVKICKNIPRLYPSYFVYSQLKRTLPNIIIDSLELTIR